MNFVALKMLLGDRAKYLSLIFTVAFASFLLANQVSAASTRSIHPSSMNATRSACVVQCAPRSPERSCR